jgi:hypothetical protein
LMRMAPPGTRRGHLIWSRRRLVRLGHQEVEKRILVPARPCGCDDLASVGPKATGVTEKVQAGGDQVSPRAGGYPFRI